MKKEVFRKYDIRGVYPDDLTEDLVVKLGRALGDMARGDVAVGRDCRNTGPQLMEWLSRGILSSGSSVLDLGVQTTPMTYFAAHCLGPSVTVMITGSHNPAQYNGFKIMRGMETIYGDAIQDIRRSMEAMSAPAVPAEGASVSSVSVRDRYFERLLGEFSFQRSLKVVVDAGNGTGGELSLEILKKLGCRVIPLYCEMNGDFPNHHPDPTVEENLAELKKRVLSEKADAGLAFDGDADRLGVVNEKGEVIWGDRILIILARSLLKTNPGATVISEVKASSLFFSEVKRAGGRALMSPTGHSIIKKALAREDALLAGEMSGHIFFRDRYYGYDDALYASLRLLEILASSKTPLSEYLSDLPPVFNTPEIREECPDEHKFEIVREVTRSMEEDGFSVDTTDGARITFPDGWGLVRASNTQPVLVLRFEAGTQEALADYEKTIREHIRRAGRKYHV